MPWKTSWSYAQRGTRFTSWNQDSFTYQIPNNLCGTALRVKYSNWYGREACEVRGVRLDIEGRQVRLQCRRKDSFTVRAAEDIYSDVFDIGLKPCSITVFMRFSSTKRPESGNTFRPGVAMIIQSLEVWCENDVDVVALFGDSITHWGNWANPMIRRMYVDMPGKISIFEVAINGSRLLNGSPEELEDGLGYDAITRLRHDVLEQKGVTCCVFALGLNDLSLDEEPGEKPLTYESYVSCVSRIIRQAHDAGIRIIGLTICPRIIEGNYTKEKNGLRQRINTWIMEEAGFDYALDVSAAVADKGDTALRKQCDSGDGIHINEYGGEKIAALFTPEIFGGRQCFAQTPQKN